MGNASSSKKNPPVIAQCGAPVYCVKRIGPRHLLLGGGGGAAKTGVPNQIENHLLSFELLSNPQSPGDGKPTLLNCGSVRTDPYATMCMDVIDFGRTEAGQYLIATGHDQYCDLYETLRHKVVPNDGGEPVLTFEFRHVAKFITDHLEDGYQKCVRFDRSTSGRRLVTGGADGHIRVFDVRQILENRNPNLERKPILEVQAHHGDVNDVDVSQDGRAIISVGDDGKVLITDIETGKKLLELPTPLQLPKGYKVRAAKYAPLGGNNLIFVTAYNEIQMKTKTVSYLALWAFNRERQTCKPIVLRDVCKEGISSISLSPCGNYIGLGTLAGSVGIFDTHELKTLHWAQETHEIFVTDVEFLDRRSGDLSLQPAAPGGQVPIVPGPAASSRASLVSLSADMKVQLHVLPKATPPSFTSFLLKASVASLISYYLVWSLAS